MRIFPAMADHTGTSEPVPQRVRGVFALEIRGESRTGAVRVYGEFQVLSPSPTVTECPYRGRTSSYWSARVGDLGVADIAWSYEFPTRQLLPISNLIAFYDEHADLHVDGVRMERRGRV